MSNDCLSYIVVCHHPKAGGGAWQTAGVGPARNMGGGQDNLWVVISSIAVYSGLAHAETDEGSTIENYK